MPRQKRQRCSSGLYHVIQRAEAHKLFEDVRDKDTFLRILEQSKQKNAFALFGFCLAMDQEYHLVLASQAGDLSKIMKEINIRYALYKGKKQLFKDRFVSHALADCSAVLEVRSFLQERRARSLDPYYVELCSTHHFLLDDPLTYVPCAQVMDLAAVQKDLALELARLQLEDFDDHMEERNEWVRKIRRNSPLSLKQIGTLLGLSESSISKILNA